MQCLYRQVLLYDFKTYSTMFQWIQKEPLSLNLGGELVSLSRPLIMGILNITPDSFYPGSRTTEEEQIAERLHKMVNEGADIIDIGAYSSRPNAYFHRFSFRSCSCIFYQPYASVKEKGNPDNDDHCCHIKHCLLSFYRFMEPYTHFWENHIRCLRLLLSYHLVASRRTVDKYFHRVDTETKYLPGGID